MPHFSVQEMKEIIESYGFKQNTSFNLDQICLKYLISYINQLHINATTLHLVKKLIQFYKLPVMLCFQQLYNKMGQSEIDFYDQELLEISQIVKQILAGFQFQQLLFFQRSTKTYQNSFPFKKLASHEANFIQFASRVSKVVSQAMNTSALVCSFANRAHHRNLNTNFLNEQCKKCKIDFEKALLTKDINCEGPMVLQNHYIHLMTLKFYFHMQKINEMMSILETSSKQLIENQDFNGSMLSEEESTNSNFYSLNKEEEDKAMEYSQKVNEILTCFQEKKNIINHKAQALPKTPSTNTNLSFPIKQSSLNLQKLQFSLPLCCREYFYENETISEYDKQIHSFITSKELLGKQMIKRMKQELCSMVNHHGGVILLGVTRFQRSDCFTISGFFITEQQKEEIHIKMRQIFQQIQPQIILSNLYEVEFLPICLSDRSLLSTQKSSNSPQFIGGQFLIRVKVQQGIRYDIYSFKQENEDMFYNRNSEGIYLLQGRQLLKQARLRIVEKPSLQNKNHYGKCRKPQKGLLIYSKDQVMQIERLEKSKQKAKSAKSSVLFQKIKQQQTVPQHPKQIPNNLKYIHKVTVFNIAFDFLIFGLQPTQLISIFQSVNLFSQVQIKPLTSQLTYLRNRFPQNIKQVKTVLKNLKTFENCYEQNYEIIPLSRFIKVNDCSVQMAFELINNKKCVYLSYVQPNYTIFQLGHTFSGCQTYIQFRNRGLACKFVVDPFNG